MSVNQTEAERLAARRRLRREFAAMTLIILVIGGLFILERYALSFPVRYNLGNNLLFFGLVNLNLILICVLLFLILRNLAKLIFERRQNILGARLRTKLIAAFSGFALVPTVIMFYAAWSFVSRSIENWFSVQVETSLDESLQVAQRYYSTYEVFSKLFAMSLADAVREGVYLPPAPPGKKPGVKMTADDKNPAETDATDGIAARLEKKPLSEFLEKKRVEYGLFEIEVYQKGDGAKPYLSIRETQREKKGEPTSKEFLDHAWDGQAVAEVFAFKHDELVKAVAPVLIDGGIRAAIVTSYAVPHSVLKKMNAIRKTYEDYRQLLLLKEPVMSSYIVFFALISAFIFFSATWFGFFLARGIAIPIQRMAEATERVAAGDLDAKIEYRSPDEMGRLIGSFNKMIEDLRLSRGQIEKAAQDLRATNLELEERRRYMETVLANITAGVISFSADGRISTINRRACEILGFEEEIIGTDFRDAFATITPQESIREFISEVTGPDARFIERETEVQIGSEPRTLLVRLTVLPSSLETEAITAVMVLDDITELIKAKRVSAWREIARRIAHEIKNPLTPIQLAAQRLRKRYGSRFTDESDQVFFESTATIIRQVGEMKRLVQEFSDFARLAEVLPGPNQINEIISETLVLYSEAHSNIDFRFEPDAALPVLQVDRSQIKRVFINLLDNAVDAITGTGSVEIKTGVDEERSQVFVRVADSGSGLPETYRQRLYEPYFSTKKMGTGLGLAIVHQIMTDHGGRIELADNSPKGTLVTLSFPLRLAVTDATKSDTTAAG